MSESRGLHLNVHIHETGHHEAAWRLPESDPLAVTKVEHYINLAQIAERGTLDSLFWADVPVLSGNPRHRPSGLLEPLTLIAALAVKTERVGLIATASTSYKDPYDLARSFASIDHISGGRAGWNIVTTAGDAAAANFGRDAQALHKDRYERADEFLEVVTKLWDSWEDDARVVDKDAGLFADVGKIHKVGHVGKHFRVAGALNLPRSPQAYPVLVQAGSSLDGRIFASRWAEAVFTAQRTLAEGQAFYADVKGRTVASGRREQDIVILPGLVPFLGSTEAEARARQAEFEERMIPAYGLAQLSQMYGVDLTDADLDGPLPEVPVEDDIEGAKSRTTLITSLARGQDLTVRQLLRKLGGGRGHRQFTGTPEQLAENIELWFRERGADGFNVQPPALPGDLETFVDHVVPILRKRGLFRHEYESTTLREHYGLSRPVNKLATRNGRPQVTATGELDWFTWHQSYEDSDSALSRRLVVIQGWLRQALDRLPPGPIKLISFCAGQARDVVGALRDHPRAGDVSGRIVELDARNTAAARAALSAVVGDRIEAVSGDAGKADAFRGVTPAQILVVVGVFGNITDEHLERTIRLLPGFAAPGAFVVWSRGGADDSRGDINPLVREWFADSGFTELDHTYIDGRQGLGFHRFDGTPLPFPAGRGLFEFVGWEAKRQRTEATPSAEAKP